MWTLALHRIKLSLDPTNPGTELIHACVSTQKGFSLLQIEELSQKLGLYFQMAFREKDAAFVVPSLVHLKLDHFAAITRQEGDRYLLQDPTFGNDVWVTREALEAETSGYFLIPSEKLAQGWRAVKAQEGETVWGKGLTAGNDPGPHGPCDPATPGGNSCPKNDGDCKGMAVPRVHLMLVSLNINDEPVGYSPPVGPAVRFTVRYNQREARQPSTFTYSNFGPKWTFDWLSYITDNPFSPAADVTYYIMGGGTRTFTGFVAAGTPDPPNPPVPFDTYAFQQFDQTKLTRTSANTYEMLSRDGTRKVFSQSDGSISISRKIFLTQLIDPYGNAVTLSYDANLRVVTITDAIGQVTCISYDHLTDIHKITKVTDPFGRSATFGYDAQGRLIKITDVIGITSQFTYDARRFHRQVDHALWRHYIHQGERARQHPRTGDHLSRWRQGPRRIYPAYCSRRSRLRPSAKRTSRYVGLEQVSCFPQHLLLEQKSLRCRLSSLRSAHPPLIIPEFPLVRS